MTTPHMTLIYAYLSRITLFIYIKTFINFGAEVERSYIICDLRLPENVLKYCGLVQTEMRVKQ